MTHSPWSVFQSPVALMAKVFQDGTDWATTMLAEEVELCCCLQFDGRALK